MLIDDLEEALSEILPVGFQIETNKRGQIIILTNLRADDDGELIDFDSEEAEESEFDPLDDEDEDEDDEDDLI
jgi:hypothetical protein